tara:strand:- start:665 stop:1240 length:576 start_codon:yes stop_codon:yes gene_type:complete
MMYFILLLFLAPCFGQNTQTTKSVNLTTSPNIESKIGSLNSGTTIKKLKLDPSGKFVKVTFEAYVSVDALKDPTVSLPVGSSQIADDVKYKLISAKQSGNRVNIKVQITNQRAKPFDFMAMTLFKMYASGENVGELNPFEGNNTVSFGLKKGKPVIANMVFDFKKPPKDAELSCVSTIKAGGEKVYFQLGF